MQRHAKVTVVVILTALTLTTGQKCRFGRRQLLAFRNPHTINKTKASTSTFESRRGRRPSQAWIAVSSTYSVSVMRHGFIYTGTIYIYAVYMYIYYSKCQAEVAVAVTVEAAS